MLSGVVFAVLFAQVLLYPGIPDLVVALGGTPASWDGDVGAILDAGKWFLTAEFVGFVLCAGLWGAFSDATGARTPLIVAGAAVGAGGYLTLAVVPTVASMPYSGVLAIRFFQGAATIGAFSLSITTLMDLEGGGGRNMGAAGLAIGAGTALGSPIGGVLYGVGPFVPLYAAAVVLGAAGLLATRATDRAPTPTHRTPAAVVRGLRGRPSLAVPFAFGFADRFTAGFFALVGVAFLQARFGLDPAATGLLLGAFFIPFALLQYPLGVLSDRVGRIGPVAAGSFAYGLVIVGVAFAPTVPVAAVVMALVGAFGALCAPATLALVQDLAAADQRGTATGGFNVVGSLGFLAGVVGGGLLAERVGYTTAFLVAGGAELLLAVALLPALFRLDTDRVATFADGSEGD